MTVSTMLCWLLRFFKCHAQHRYAGRHYAGRRYAERRYAERRYAARRYAARRYAERRYAECRYVVLWILRQQKNFFRIKMIFFLIK